MNASITKGSIVMPFKGGCPLISQHFVLEGDVYVTNAVVESHGPFEYLIYMINDHFYAAKMDGDNIILG